MSRRALNRAIRSLACGLLLAFAPLGGCKGTVVSDAPKDIPLAQARNIIVEVDYMPGAEPSFEFETRDINPWLIFQLNITTLLAGHVEGLDYPTTPDRMGRIDAPAGKAFSAQDIIDLAATHRDILPGPQDAHFHVLFLDGTSAEAGDGGTPRAVHIDGTRIVAVFSAAQAKDSDTEIILEQSAMLHELGHALGLVDLGIADTSGHTDPSSPVHCNEDDCIMRDVATLTDSAQAFEAGGEVPVLFGLACRKDVEAHFR